ncbi:hypothetical protein BST43_05915 [Mycobacteroides saopaulense]|uniref:Uncharacterized protein n=1 Tax=Mycobacteroides saopaulense TaxID=1578165 RepID=A0A1X0JAI2_9MYCO|nr:hypothetical protein BST43_05915 [Mycobacteroides saopaulense]
MTADAALPVVPHHFVVSVSGDTADAGHDIGRAAQDFSCHVFDVIAGKIRSGSAFRMLWAAAMVVSMILVLRPLRVVATRAPPRHAYWAVTGGRARLQQICVSRR